MGAFRLKSVLGVAVAASLVASLVAHASVAAAEPPSAGHAAASHLLDAERSPRQATGRKLIASRVARAGRKYVLRASGLPAGVHVYPFITVGSKIECCGAGFTRVHQVSNRGRVRIAFKWPRRFVACASRTTGNCEGKPWGHSRRTIVGLRIAELSRVLGVRSDVAAQERVRVLSAGPSSRKRSAVSPTLRQVRRPLDAAPAREQTSSSPGVETIPSLSKCSSPWMSQVGWAGTGEMFNVSFVPTAFTRLLGRSVPGGYQSIWNDLHRCATFPSDLSVDQEVSLYEQLVCHVEFGVFGFGGSTFDLEAYHPIVPRTVNPVDLAKAFCNWSPDSSVIAAYSGHIIQSNDDGNAQKTAWLLTGSPGNWQRHWIPTSAIYNCLRSRGTAGPDQVAGLLIADYVAASSDATCTSAGGTPTTTPPTTPPPPPQTTPPANPTFTGGYVIDDAFYGGTWPRLDPNDGTWYPKSSRPANAATYWWANGLGVGFSCGTYAAAYTVRFVDGHSETWNTWLRSTDTYGGRVTGLWVPSAVAEAINTNGIPPGMPSC